MKAPFGATSFGSANGPRVNVDVSVENDGLIEWIKKVDNWAMDATQKIPDTNFTKDSYRPLLDQKGNYKPVLRLKMNLDRAHCYTSMQEPIGKQPMWNGHASRLSRL